jgi:hypothetical protein
MVDEPAGDAVAELGVVAGVEDEGVPSRVDRLRRRQVIVRMAGAGGEEGQGLLHDPFGRVPV